MIRMTSIAVGLFLASAAAQAQQSAKFQVTVRVPAALESFQSSRLVAVLAREDLSGEGRDFVVDRTINEKIAHVKGKETIIKLTVGANAKLTPGANHKLTVIVFSPTSQRTHIADREGSFGPIFLTTGNWPTNVNVVLRAEK